MNAKIGVQTKLIWETFHQWKAQIESIEEKEVKNKTLENIKTFTDLQTQYSQQLKLILESKQWTPEDQIWFDVYSEIWSKDIQLTDESHLEGLNADPKYKELRQKSFTVPFKKLQTKFRKQLKRDLDLLNIDKFNAYIDKQSKQRVSTRERWIRKQAFGTLNNDIRDDEKNGDQFEEEEDDELHQMPCADTKESRGWANGLSAEVYLETLRDVPKKTLNLAVGSVLLFNEPYFGIWSADKDKEYENDVVNEEEAKKVENDKLFQEYKSAYKSHAITRYLDFANDPEDFEAKEVGETDEHFQERLQLNSDLELEMAKERNLIWKELIEMTSEEDRDRLYYLAARFVKLRLYSTSRIELRYVKALYHCAKRKEVINLFFEIVEQLLSRVSSEFFNDDEWNDMSEEDRDEMENSAKQSVGHMVDSLFYRMTKNDELLKEDLEKDVAQIAKLKKDSQAFRNQIREFVKKIKGNANVLLYRVTNPDEVEVDRGQKILSQVEMELISRVPLYDVEQIVRKVNGKDDKKLSKDIWKSILMETYFPESLLEALAKFQKKATGLKTIEQLQDELKKATKAKQLAAAVLEAADKKLKKATKAEQLVAAKQLLVAESKREQIHKELQKWFVLVDALSSHTETEIDQMIQIRALYDVGPKVPIGALMEARKYAEELRKNPKRNLFKELWPKEWAMENEMKSRQLKQAKRDQDEAEEVKRIERKERKMKDFVKNAIRSKKEDQKNSEYVDDEVGESYDEDDGSDADPDATETDEDEEEEEKEEEEEESVKTKSDEEENEKEEEEEQEEEEEEEVFA